MTKQQKEAREIIRATHEITDRPFKERVREIRTFIERLVCTLIAFAAIGVGAANLVTATRLGGPERVAAIIAGVTLGLHGCWLMYVALMKVGRAK